MRAGNAGSNPAGVKLKNEHRFVFGGTMNEKPILFQYDMIRAILKGRKTVTRRIIKPTVKGCTIGVYTQDGKVSSVVNVQEDGDPWTDIKCPYGQVGDRLWVRETFFTFPSNDHLKPSEIPHTESIESMHKNDIDYLASPIEYYNRGRIRQSIFMPRWASRITLGITEIKIERVQDIEIRGIQNEGIRVPILVDSTEPLVNAYITLWDSINKKRGFGWDSNPWVWVIKFKRI